VLCGTTLLGWEGALIAVPFAAMLQVVFEEVIVPGRLAQWDTRGDGGEERAGANERVSSSPWATTGRRRSVIHFTRG
jgi:hypothetical protein